MHSIVNYFTWNSTQLKSPTFQRQSKVLVKIFEVYDLQSNLSVVIICVVALISLLFVLLVLSAILVGANVSPASFNDHMKSNIHSSVSNINKSKTLGCLNPFCRWQTKLKQNRTEQSRAETHWQIVIANTLSQMNITNEKFGIVSTELWWW